MAKPAANRVRELRAARELTQSGLADLAGLSRQSVNAIEAGRTTPSVDVALRIAQALECRVEELFGSPAAESATLLTEPSATVRSGRVVLAHLAGRWVSYALPAQRSQLSADAIASASAPSGRRVIVEPIRSLAEARDNIVMMGCAAGLGVLADRLNAQRGPGRFVWLARSSSDALRALARDQAHLSGVHLVDPKTGEANVADTRRLAAGKALVLITLARWEAGLLTAPGNPRQLRAASDLGRRGLRLAVREHGSGARRLLERELRAARLQLDLARAGHVQVGGHLEVAHAIALNAADAGVATRDAALAYGLHFVPLAEERYDLALTAEALTDPRIQRLLDVMTASAFRRELSSLGYDVRGCGDRVAEVSAA